MDYRFLTVDVFASKRFEGAQIAVVPNAESLTDIDMQQLASEFNLWRTVFLLPSETNGVDFSIRIFNHQKEFSFGGHATIAAIYALAELQLLNLVEGKNQFVLSEKSGDVTCMVDVKNGQVRFNQFSAKNNIEIDRFTPSVSEISDFLSLQSKHLLEEGFKALLVASHVPYLFVPVDNAASLADIRFDYKAWSTSSAPQTLASTIFAFSQSTDKEHAHFHCRLIGPNFAEHEDPPIGAAMSAFAGYLTQFDLGKAAPVKFIAERGIHAGRKSIVHGELVAFTDNVVEVKIGGEAVLVSEGRFHL